MSWRKTVVGVVALLATVVLTDETVGAAGAGTKSSGNQLAATSIVNVSGPAPLTSLQVYTAAAPASGSTRARFRATPAWARPLSGVGPYYVERNYGTSRGLTCDLAVYTTNRAALDGRASLRLGDVTATVCVVRRVGR